MAELAKFSIEVHPLFGLRSVVVNGLDLTDSTAGVAIVVEPGKPPTIDLRILGAEIPVLEGEGVVRLLPDVDERQAVLEFLDAIDPEELDRQVLGGMGWGDGGSPMAMALAVLKEIARGAQA